MTAEQARVIEAYPSLRYWGSGVAHAVTWALLIEEDHGYTFKTVEQRYNHACQLPCGPAKNCAQFKTQKQAVTQ